MLDETEREHRLHLERTNDPYHRADIETSSLTKQPSLYCQIEAAHWNRVRNII